MIGFHFQRTVPDWPRAVAQLPAGAPVKAVDNVQLLDEAKRHNPGVYTILRHHYDGVGVGGQHFNGSADWTTYIDAARHYLSTFVDGTFAQFAANVNAIEDWNEYHATSDTPAETATRTAWARALCNVWAGEYRALYPKIEIILANTAIGNDIPASIAWLTHEFPFALIGYHPYVPVQRDGTILAGEWQHYSGRWEVMDEAWRAAGLRVRWAFTEAGPVGMTPGGGLDAVNGWRAGHVFGGDVDKYIGCLRYWADKVAPTRAYREGRVIGAVLFTSNEFGQPWQQFETRQPEMDAIAAFARQWVADNPPGDPVPPPPPPPPVEERRYSRTYYLLPQSATTEQAQRVMAEAWANKSTVGGSVDDAFVDPPEVTKRRVIVYDVDAIAGNSDALEDWVSIHYGMDALTLEYRRFSFPYHLLDFGRLFREPYVRTGAFNDPRVYNGQPALHEGADYDVTTTTALVDVLSLHGGKVTRSEDTTGGYGKLIVIEGTIGSYVYRTWYAHLSARFVNVGDTVAKGQAIGKLGSTGNSSGPHTHVNLQVPGHGLPGYVVPDVVDPAPWIPRGQIDP